MTFDEIVMEGFLEVAAFELCLRHAEGLAVRPDGAW